jgi:hypothetical protein
MHGYDASRAREDLGERSRRSRSATVWDWPAARVAMRACCSALVAARVVRVATAARLVPQVRPGPAAHREPAPPAPRARKARVVTAGTAAPAAARPAKPFPEAKPLAGPTATAARAAPKATAATPPGRTPPPSPGLPDRPKPLAATAGAAATGATAAPAPTPRGHSRSTGTRAPSSDIGGSQIRRTCTRSCLLIAPRQHTVKLASRIDTSRTTLLSIKN